MIQLYWAVFIACFLGAAQLNAIMPGIARPIEVRFANSTIVGVGEILGVKQTNAIRRTDGRLNSADYDVIVQMKKIYKGHVGTLTLTINFSNLDPASGPPARSGQSYLFFLQGENNLPVKARGLEEEMVPFSIPFGDSNSLAGLLGLEKDLQEKLLDAASSDSLRQSLRILSQFSSISEQTAQILENLLSANSSFIRVDAFEILIESGAHSGSYVSNLILELKNGQESNYDNMDKIVDIVASRSSKKDILNLEDLAVKHGQPLRLSAIMAIRRLQSPESIGFLLQMLDFQDKNVQYQAVIALAEITKMYGDYAPSIGSFDADPSKYIALWKKWGTQTTLHI